MNRFLRKLFRIHNDESGAALLYVTIAIPTLFAITSLAIDLGYIWYVKTRLQVAADMGALAGASKLYTDDAAAVEALAIDYANTNLPSDWLSGQKPAAKSTPEVKCLETIEDMGLTCSSLSGGNALKVTVSTTAPLFFANALGFKTIKLSADSVVSGGGSSPPPLNVAIVLDATASMNYSLGNGVKCGILTNPKKIECASLAAKTLLTKLWASVDQVALYTYPAFDPQSKNVATCKPGNSGKLGQVSYTTAAAPNYQLYGFNNSYMDTGSPPKGGLITTSDMVLALGKTKSSNSANDGTNCAGLATNGLGIGTSIADAIAQAQRDLVQANVDLVKAGQPKRQNVMIVLSDGDANGNSTSLTGPNPPDDEFVTGTDNFGIAMGKWVVDVDKMAGQCKAAVAAADVAEKAGTWVYSVAFAAPATAKGSCFTDRSAKSVIKDKTTSPALTAADNITLSSRNCSNGNRCKAIPAGAPTVTSKVNGVVKSGSKKTQTAVTTWGTIATTCTQPDGSRTGRCDTVLTPTKIQTDTYDLNAYDITACETMQQIASDDSKFYSTDGGDKTKCPSAANPNFTDLVAIFNNVAASIMKKRRIPSSTT